MAASTSAILRLAVSSAASCFALSSLKITSPCLTEALTSTWTSATRPVTSDIIGTVRKYNVADVGRRMKIEDHRDQRDREHQASDDAPPQFEPDRKERDFVAEALSLPVAAIEIVRQDRHAASRE